MNAPLLSLEHIHRDFGDIRALSDASMIVRPGTVHALLGENGAGKTTLMRIAYGMLRPHGGIVRSRGHALTLRSAADALAAGIGMVHQHFMLVPAFTVAENIALGLPRAADSKRIRTRIETMGANTGFRLDPEALAANLNVGQQQQLELLKALMRDVSLLILEK